MRTTLSSPKILVGQIAAAILVSLSGIVLLSVPFRRPIFLGIAIVTLFAMIVGAGAESVLRRGVESKRWGRELLDPAAQWIGRPVFFFTVLLTFVGSTFLVERKFEHPSSLFWLAFFPLLTISRVGALLQPPVKLYEGGELGLEASQPISSSSWGRQRSLERRTLLSPGD